MTLVPSTESTRDNPLWQQIRTVARCDGVDRHRGVSSSRIATDGN